MKVLRRAWVSGIIFSIIFAFASCLLAQEAEAPQGELQQTTPAEIAVSAEPAATVTLAEPVAPAVAIESAAPAEAQSTEWVWGEVVSVDTENKQIVLKHLDYETYEEIQTTLKVGDKTLLENVATLGEIKAGNHLTADFKVVAGSNIADLIVIEKDIQEEIAVPETAAVPVPETVVVPALETAVAPVPVPEVPVAPAAIPAQEVNDTTPIANVQ